jgi:hypothetical protein
MPSRAYRPVAPAVLLLMSTTVGGCTHWKTQAVFPAEYVIARQPPVVRVSRTDGGRVVLHRPSVAGDTMYGVARNRKADPSTRPAVPLSEIDAIAVRRIDPWGTIGVTLGVAAVGAIAVIGAIWDQRAD